MCQWNELIRRAGPTNKHVGQGVLLLSRQRALGILLHFTFDIKRSRYLASKDACDELCCTVCQTCALGVVDSLNTPGVPLCAGLPLELLEAPDFQMLLNWYRFRGRAPW